MQKRAYVNRIVKEALKRGLVTGVSVEVGELAPISAYELADALRSATEWEVTVEETPATVRCRCTYEGRPRMTEKSLNLNVYHCPACGRLAPEVVDGSEVVLSQVRVKGEEEESIVDLLFQLPKLF